jgi:hypothetical protein
LAREIPDRGSGGSLSHEQDIIMETAQQCADRYVAVWNESNADARRATIARLWTEGGRHYMGERAAEGYAALEKRITGSYERSVRDGGNLFHAMKDARSLRDIVAFGWEMAPAAGGEAIASGLAILLLAEDGRIRVDYLFALK